MNKKGFTLIELLAVIVILAIVALVATPIIITSIKNARMSSAKASALGYIQAVDNYVSMHDIDENNYSEDLSYGIHNVSGEDNDVLYLNNIIKVTGEKPTSGWVKIGSKKVSQYSLVFNGYIVSKIVDNSGVVSEQLEKGN